MTPGPVPGRGASFDPPNRFEPLHLDDHPEFVDPDPEAEDRTPSPRTRFYHDHARSILTRNDSPDIPFTYSVNPYRGCEHGCIYCYARPTHETLGFSAGLEFESRILVKEQAPELLRRALMAPSWRPETIAMSGVTDPYQPVERQLELTRRCLEVLAEFKNPVTVVTKNLLVTRDIDHLGALAAEGAALVCISLTSLDRELQRTLEPRTSSPARRLRAMERLSAAGIPVMVLIAPVIPGLTDHELPGLLAAARDAGAEWAGWVPLRLPGAVAPLFERWLEDHAPERREKVLHRIREMRGGGLNDPRFGSRMRGEGVYAEQLGALFRTTARRLGFTEPSPSLSVAAFQRPGQGVQLGLFEG